MGLARRLQLARTFLVRREVYFLDEPTLGLDPLGRLKTWDMVKRLAAEGAAVFLCTNDVHEAEVLCDRVGFIDKGRLVAVGSPERLKAYSGAVRVEVEFDGRLDGGCLEGVEGVLDFVVEDGRLVLTLRDMDSLKRVFACLEGVRDFRVVRPSLEDVFRRLFGDGG